VPDYSKHNIAQFQLLSDRTIEFPEGETGKIILKTRTKILPLDGKWQVGEVNISDN